MKAKEKKINWERRFTDFINYEVNSDEAQIIRNYIDHKIKEAKKEVFDIVWSLVFLHKKCNKYHKIKGEKATCLDIVLNELMNFRK